MGAPRYPAKAYDGEGRHTGPGLWLTVIHETNRLCIEAGREPMFDGPESTGDWWAGGYVEEYAEARVLHRDKGPDGDYTNVSIHGKTPEAEALLDEAARNVESPHIKDIRDPTVRAALRAKVAARTNADA